MEFDLRKWQVPKSLDQDQIEMFEVHPVDEHGERRFPGLRHFRHQRPSVGAGQQHLPRAGLAQFIAVFAGGIELDLVVRMLDHAGAQASSMQQGDQFFQQSGLAGTAEGGEADDRQWAVEHDVVLLLVIGAI